jgi:serine-type D-Ala-D-Ala carboxypeptidase (penicillin-binding protein 5/6)
MTALLRFLASFVLLLAAGAMSLPAAAQRPLPPAVPGVPPPEMVPVAVLVDLSSGQVLHARNAERRFVPASVTKVMTLYLAFELMAEGRLDRDQTMVMSPVVFRDWRRRGSNMFLNLGDRVLVHDLLMGIANVSANDGAAVLAEGHAGSVAAWTAAMNAKASELGMTGSYFSSPNGWPDQGQTFTTANDLVVLARALITRHPTRFREYIGQPGFLYNGIAQINHDPLTGRFTGADGIKTGFTNEAGFNYLGTAQRGNQRLVMVLAGVPSGSQRAEAANNFMEWGFSAFERRRLFESGAIIAEARVQNGDARRVALVAAGPVELSLPNGHRKALTARVEYEGPLRAPITAGSEVATLLITSPGMATARIPLAAREEIALAGPLDRIVNGLAGWLPW